MRTVTILITLMVVTSIGFAAQPATASDDKWPEMCRYAEIQSPSGEYVGSIDSPEDQDLVKFRLDKGEFLTISLALPKEEGDMHIVGRGADNTYRYESGESSGSIEPSEGPSTTSFKLYAEQDGTHCIEIQDLGETAELPYQWKLKIKKNDQKPATFEGTGSSENISKLKSKLERKNKQIKQLQSTIKDLKASTNNSSTGDVTIQVTVNPANNQQNFVRGGKAVVQVKSENADVSKVAVKYGDGTYQLGSSGQVEIPLVDTGTQKMALVYGDTLKQLSIQVQEPQSQSDQKSQQQNDRDPQNEIQQNTGSGDSGLGSIGFWGSIGVGTVLLCGALLRMVS